MLPDSNDVSYGSLLHEFQHLLDDKAQGWGGFVQLSDVEHAFEMERNAYSQEIEYAESMATTSLRRSYAG